MQRSLLLKVLIWSIHAPDSVSIGRRMKFEELHTVRTILLHGQRRTLLETAAVLLAETAEAVLLAETAEAVLLVETAEAVMVAVTAEAVLEAVETTSAVQGAAEEQALAQSLCRRHQGHHKACRSTRLQSCLEATCRVPVAGTAEVPAPAEEAGATRLLPVAAFAAQATADECCCCCCCAVSAFPPSPLPVPQALKLLHWPLLLRLSVGPLHSTRMISWNLEPQGETEFADALGSGLQQQQKTALQLTAAVE